MIRTAAISVWFAISAFAQQFDSVSVTAPEAAKRGRGFLIHGGPGSHDPGHVTLSDFSIRRLIYQAFDLQANQVAGPGWMANEFYDIDAKLPTGSTKEQYKQMLQNLLAERFHLKFHMETRDLPGYELAVDKHGLKMKTADLSDDEYDHAPPRVVLAKLDANGQPELRHGHKGRMRFRLPNGEVRISGRLETIADIADVCTRELRIHVSEGTGLTGKYDFNLDFAPETGAGHDADSESGAASSASESIEATLKFPDLAAALKEQLGLNLVKKKVPTPTLVVDRVEKAKEN